MMTPLLGRKSVDEYGADLIAVRFKGADPDGKDASAEDCVATLKKSWKRLMSR